MVGRVQPPNSNGDRFSPSVLPETLESIRCEVGIAHGMGDVLVTQVMLQGSGVMTLIGEIEALMHSAPHADGGSKPRLASPVRDQCLMPQARITANQANTPRQKPITSQLESYATLCLRLGGVQSFPSR
jgi:hypothetical protein